jgi:hypothetical protein
MAAAVASDPTAMAPDPGLLEDDLDMSEELELIEDDF